MRVVHLAPHFNNSGNGVVNVAVDLACMQARAGIEVIFVGADGSFRDLLGREGVKTRSIDFNSAGQFLSAVVCLRKVLSEFDPDIVHAHMIPGAILSCILRVGLRFKLITTVHSSGRFGSRLMSVGDLTICVSNHLSREMVERGIPARRIRVVRNGPLHSPRASTIASDIRLNHPAIVTIGELATHKGIGDLISAFSLLPATLPPPSLYLVGEGAGRAGFERQARSSSCADRIVFCGAVSDPTPYLNDADIFVLASHREGFGLVLAEARNAGCAIIATEVGGIPEVLEFGQAGLLLRPHSPRDLATALTQLIESPATLDSWRARARDNLDWLSCRRPANETIAVYKEALDLVPVVETKDQPSATAVD